MHVLAFTEWRNVTKIQLGYKQGDKESLQTERMYEWMN